MLVFTKKEVIFTKKSYDFAEYGDLEQAILSCILVKPTYLDNLLVEDKHFIKNRPLFMFLKKFYEIYHNLDITLMVNLCPNNFKLIDKIIILLNIEPCYFLCEEYQKVLIKLFEEQASEREKILKAYNLVNTLIARGISIEEFKRKVGEL